MQIPKAIKISFILTWIFCVSTGGATAQFAGGSGTEEDPYKVETLEQLQLIADSVNLDKHYVQIADIDAGETIDWNEGKGFEPIGTATLNEQGAIVSKTPFTGSYNGAGFEISGLFINRKDEDCVGLFGYAEEADFKNISLEGIHIAGNYYAGGLSGYLNDGNISNSSATGEIEGYRRVGGLIGRNSGQINSSFASGTIVGGNETGGLAGFNDYRGTINVSYATNAVVGTEVAGGLVGLNIGPVDSSFATGSVSGNNGIGGLIGFHDSEETISFCYATGDIIGKNNQIGGLVGARSRGLIHNSHATGTVSGGDMVGGLAGSLGGGSLHPGLIRDSYATGAVSGGVMVGGLVGYANGGSIVDSYAEGTVTGERKVGGLIGFRAYGGDLSNLHATGDVSGIRRVGGLIGHNDSRESLIDSYATGEVSGDVRVGGFIGQNVGIVTGSYANGAVSGDDRVGGFIGQNNSGGNISSSYAGGTVSGITRVGGLVGQNNIKGKIDSSFATGNVTGSGSDTGGLVGENIWGRINNSYALGNVTGNIATGGLAGINRDEGMITTSYSSGLVSGSEDVGGFIGINNATIVSGYWDQESSEQDKGIGSGSFEGITGLATFEMTNVNAFEYMTTLDFNEIWLLTEGYPALNWEDVEALKIPTATGYEGQPVVFELRQNYPNPFNPMTNIRFDIPVESHVQLTVYNLLGQKVATLVNETRSQGRHEVPFDATNLSSGLYLYRIQTDVFSYTDSKQMLLVK